MYLILGEENLSYANYPPSFAGAMLELWALSGRQTSIGNTCITSCRHVLTSIKLHRTTLLSDLPLCETLTLKKLSMANCLLNWW